MIISVLKQHYAQEKLNELMQFSNALPLMKTGSTFPSSFVPRILSLIVQKLQIANPVSSRNIHNCTKYPTDN